MFQLLQTAKVSDPSDGAGLEKITDAIPVSVTVHTSQNSSSPAKVVIRGLNEEDLASHNGTTNEEFTFTAKSPKLWWPDSPTLYNLTVTLGSGDKVQSYTGFRTISKGKVENVTRPLLNGEFVFQFGTLDQGYWPDGLYTPPNQEAMISDLELLKKLGFNMVRKHVSVADTAVGNTIH
jgi:beta-galactosidase/beta-glucuronidase